MALDNRSDIDSVYTGLGDLGCHIVCDHGIVRHQYLAGCRIDNVTHRISSDDTVSQRLKHVLVLVVDNGGNPRALLGVALFFPDNNLLRDIDKTSGQVTGVCRTQSGIGQ